MAGKSIELGSKIWDPLGLANLGSEKTLKWFRASEVKHCRVAMVSKTMNKNKRSGSNIGMN